MADVRALLAAERESRRIQHPHLTYSKSGALTCNICNLNVKSEQLWPGHLKSLNHRRNVQQASEKRPAALTRPSKRKIDSVEPEEFPSRGFEVDSRKRPRSFQDENPVLESTDLAPTSMSIEETTAVSKNPLAGSEIPSPESVLQPPQTNDGVNEDEWAAFEKEVAPLTQIVSSSAVIEAAPVSAADLTAQQRSDPVQNREDEAQAEKEEESRRLEDEFEVMEEMEDRVRRLRERRDALRNMDHATGKPSTITITETQPNPPETAAEESSDDDAEDDWYA